MRKGRLSAMFGGDYSGEYQPTIGGDMSLRLDPTKYTNPSSTMPALGGGGPRSVASGSGSVDYSRLSRPNPIDVDKYLAMLGQPQQPRQPGRWEQALGGVGNAIQHTFNTAMGYPGSRNSGPGGWSAAGQLVDSLYGKTSPSTIGTPMDNSPPSLEGIGTAQNAAGMASAFGFMNPGAMMAMMGAGTGGAHSEPDVDEAGGSSDMDADNMGTALTSRFNPPQPKQRGFGLASAMRIPQMPAPSLPPMTPPSAGTGNRPQFQLGPSTEHINLGQPKYFQPKQRSQQGGYGGGFGGGGGYGGGF